ncbi:sulfatase-like hydrolase/transferase [Acetobacter suratthaniensis]|uniref:sulfatase-like hydrolase/transferase n=2 Tax=Acetobacter suratthaniensis TaxID=1502841 RepID=UPI0031F42D4B
MRMNIPIGSETFPHIATPDMPYVSDKTLAGKIIFLCSETPDPLFLYAVTIENHGPWKEKGTPLTSYLDHLKKSDTMIGDIMKALAIHDRSALFVFFGDHRPSIPPRQNAAPLILQFHSQKKTQTYKRPQKARSHRLSYTNLLKEKINYIEITNIMCSFSATFIQANSSPTIHKGYPDCSKH